MSSTITIPSLSRRDARSSERPVAGPDRRRPGVRLAVLIGASVLAVAPAVTSAAHTGSRAAVSEDVAGRRAPGISTTDPTADRIYAW